MAARELDVNQVFLLYVPCSLHPLFISPGWAEGVHPLSEPLSAFPFEAEPLNVRTPTLDYRLSNVDPCTVTGPELRRYRYWVRVPFHFLPARFGLTLWLPIPLQRCMCTNMP